MQKIALQIYSLRQELFDGKMAEVLHSVREMGYDGVEWFGMLPGISAAELARRTTDAGLAFFSVHTDWNGIAACDRDLLHALHDAGCRYIPIGWLPEERIAGGALFDETCAAIRKYAEAAGAYDITVLYHNHDFDLARLPDGRTKLDALYEVLPETVLRAELDTCWLYSGGVDPIAYVQKYADRTPILHLKDCVKEGGRKEYRPVGSGVLDFPAILAMQRSDWLCVEQDEPSMGLTASECAKASIDYLRSL